MRTRVLIRKCERVSLSPSLRTRVPKSTYGNPYRGARHLRGASESLAERLPCPITLGGAAPRLSVHPVRHYGRAEPSRETLPASHRGERRGSPIAQGRGSRRACSESYFPHRGERRGAIERRAERSLSEPLRRSQSH